MTLRYELETLFRVAHRSVVCAVGQYLPRTDKSPILDTVPSAAQYVRESGQGAIIPVSASQEILVPPVAADSTWCPPGFTEPVRLRFPANYAVTLPHVGLLDKEAYVLAEHKLVLDLSPYYGRTIHDHPALRLFRLPAPDRIDAATLVVTSIDPKNHYHWLLDALPRFEVARMAGLKWQRVMAPAMTPVHRACLARLGVSPDSVLSPPFERQVTVREAVLGTYPSLRYAPSPFAIDFAQRIFADCRVPDAKLPRKIYIARSTPARRRVLNEAAVLDTLRQQGFEVLQPERFTIEEQAKLFFNAEVIVAPHGAALANAAFCRKGTRLIELFSRHFAPPFYRNLAAAAELSYACISDGTESPGGLEGRYRHEGLTVNISALRRLL